MPAWSGSYLRPTRPSRVSSIGSRGGVPGSLERRAATVSACATRLDHNHGRVVAGDPRSSKTSLLEVSCGQDSEPRKDVPESTPRPRHRRTTLSLAPGAPCSEPYQLPTWQVRPIGARPAAPTPDEAPIRRRKLLRPAAPRSILGSPIARSPDGWSIFFFPLASAAAASPSSDSPIDSRADARSIFFPQSAASLMRARLGASDPEKHGRFGRLWSFRSFLARSYADHDPPHQVGQDVQRSSTRCTCPLPGARRR